MHSRLIYTTCCALFAGLIGNAIAQEKDAGSSPAKTVYPLKVPAAATQSEKKSTDAVTKPFRPATRLPARMRIPTASKPMTNLVFDAEVKELKAQPLEYDLSFTFAVTNVSSVPVVIGSVRTSCGCTVAELPDLPWKIDPGMHGSFNINMDLRGKRGSITKSVYISSDQGNKTIYVRGILPDAATLSPAQRQRNQMMAKADRQAVFKGQCASCHVTPTINKTGSALYQTACNICHGTAHRAEMVPDLTIAKADRDRDYWLKWIAEGKDGTLMPAFSKKQGGPLSDAQIISLAHWLTRNFPNTPASSAPVQRNAPVNQ